MSGPRYSIIPAAAVTDPRLEGRDLQVLALLGTHTNDDGWCRRSQVKMAEQIRCSRSTVQTSLGRLVASGWIEVRSQQRSDGGDASHWYRVKLDVEAHQTAAAEASRLIDGADEEARSSLRENNNPPADLSAGVPALDRHPPAGPGPAPLTKISNDPKLTLPPKSPQGDEREARASKLEDADDRPMNGSADEGEDDPEFVAFFSSWPTSALDSRRRAWANWQKLTPGERKAAVERVGDFLDFAKKQGRKNPIGSDTYLRERRWVNLPKAPSKAMVGVEVRAFSKDFWALMARYFLRDDVAKRTRMVGNAIKGASTWLRTEEAPTAAECDQLEFAQVGSPHFDAWKTAYDRKGLVMPMPGLAGGVFLPRDPPPIEKPREIPPDALAAMQRLGLRTDKLRGDR